MILVGTKSQITISFLSCHVYPFSFRHCFTSLGVHLLFPLYFSRLHISAHFKSHFRKFSLLISFILSILTVTFAHTLKSGIPALYNIPSNSNICKISIMLLFVGIYQDSPLLPVYIPLMAFSLGVLLILSSSVLLYFPSEWYGGTQKEPAVTSFFTFFVMRLSFPPCLQHLAKTIPSDARQIDEIL